MYTHISIHKSKYTYQNTLYSMPYIHYIDAKLRECDLLQVTGQWPEAYRCWIVGVERFPTSINMLNELGTLLARVRGRVRIMTFLVYSVFMTI